MPMIQISWTCLSMYPLTIVIHLSILVSKENDLDSSASSLDTDMEDNTSQSHDSHRFPDPSATAPVPNSVLIPSGPVDDDPHDVSMTVQNDYLSTDLSRMHLLHSNSVTDPNLNHHNSTLISNAISNDLHEYHHEPVAPFFTDLSSTDRLGFATQSKAIGTPSSSSSLSNVTTGSAFDPNGDINFLYDLVTPPSHIRPSLLTSSNPNQFFENPWNGRILLPTPSSATVVDRIKQELDQRNILRWESSSSSISLSLSVPFSMYKKPTQILVVFSSLNYIYVCSSLQDVTIIRNPPPPEDSVLVTDLLCFSFIHAFIHFIVIRIIITYHQLHHRSFAHVCVLLGRCTRVWVLFFLLLFSFHVCECWCASRRFDLIPWVPRVLVSNREPELVRTKEWMRSRLSLDTAKNIESKHEESAIWPSAARIDRMNPTRRLLSVSDAYSDWSRGTILERMMNAMYR